MKQNKGANILVLELHSKIDQKIENAIERINCEHLIIAKTIDEFEEALQFEPIDLVLVSAPITKKVLLDKAIEICDDYNVALIVLSEDQLELNDSTLIPISECEEYLVQYVEEMGFKKSVLTDHSAQKSTANLIDDSIFVKSNQQYQRIPFNEILFIKSDHVYLEIHTLKQKFLVRASFKEYADKLPSDNFYRAHKSYMVNIKHISAINQADVVINQIHIPISREFKTFITKSIKT